ncbi:MAG: hypothetical protein M3442_04475, partial [Chloroflexota bacterium]|nr:hypothetical protein [Chloroflexota bacterium]
FEPSGGPSVSYTYAPNGARRSRSDAQGTEYYLVDDFLVDQPSAIADGMLGGPAARVLMVSDREGRARRRLTYGTTLLGWEEDGRSVELLDDGMGSTRLVMGAAGETLSSRSYLAHGAAVNASPGAAAGWSRSGGAVSFRGRLMDPESGLYVHGAAIYDPLTATVLNPSAGAFGWTAADGTLQDLTAGVSNASASAALGLWDGRAAPPSLFAFPDRRGYHGPERERLPASTPLLIAGRPDAAGSATEGGDRWLTRR